MPRVVDQDMWARLRPGPCDKISIRNLSLKSLSSTDVWGRKKTQPVQVSVTLLLRQPFQSAAEGDVLDSSTVHYGHLSKNIESKVNAKTAEGDWLSGYELALLVEEAARSTAGDTALAAIEIDILYPKASIKGDGVGILYNRSYGDRAESNELRAIYVKNIHKSAIIGINSHERNMKQPLVASLWVENVEEPEAVEDCNKAVSVLKKSIKGTSFGTLESLAAKVASDILEDFVNHSAPGASVRLRVEKPLAVPPADAPAVEIFRRSPFP